MYIVKTQLDEMTCEKNCVNKHRLYLNSDIYSINEDVTEGKKKEPMLASMAVSTDWVLFFLAQAESSEVNANACS